MVETGSLTVVKVSELIKALEQAQNSFGDVNVFFKGKIIIAERQDSVMKSRSPISCIIWSNRASCPF